MAAEMASKSIQATRFTPMPPVSTWCSKTDMMAIAMTISNPTMVLDETMDVIGPRSGCKQLDGEDPDLGPLILAP
ncbi:MAG: hypothetical protein JRN54_08045 [Nitrososphaerota archaeon]|nr:hypothetical protein [Nitrososphaerota archaeon]